LKAKQLAFKSHHMKSLLLSSLTIFVSHFLCAQKDTTAVAADTTAAKELSNLIVKSMRKPIEVLPDKTVLNLDAQPSAVGENMLDVLRRSPGVSVDGAENLQMSGKSGVQVYIDGRPSQLTGQDLAQFLKSIEAANVKQVEIITNPSARFDAAGNAGIINIKLKKSLTDGFSGNLSGSYVQSIHARQNAAANLSWRRRKTVLFFNGSGYNGVQHTTANNDRIAGSNTITQRSVERDYFHGYSIRAGADYAVNDKTTLGFIWMNNNRYTRMDNSSTTKLQLPGAPDTVITTRSVAPFPSHRNAFNLNYAYTTAKTELTLDADYTQYNTAVQNDLSNEFGLGNGVKFSKVQTSNNQNVHIRLASFRLDWNRQMSKQLKLESGFKAMNTCTQNNLTVDNNWDNAWVKDTGKTNFFRFNETIDAVYTALKGEVKKWSWQAGLRGEWSKIEGTSLDLKGIQINQPDTAYFNLFPTVFLQYQLAQKHSINLTANRRIDRPSYQDQNPFIYALDALNSEGGNAALLPQFTNNVELGYTYNYATSIKISYAKTTGYIEQLTYQDGKNTIRLPQNAGTREVLSISFSTPMQPTKHWNVYLWLSPYYHHYNTLLSSFGLTETQRGGSWGFNGYMSNNITLGKGWTTSLSSWFNFQNRATIYVSRPLGSLDLGLQKNLFHDKATIKLSWVDMLNTQQWQQTATTSNLQLSTYRKWESQNITLGFSWRFGNDKLKNARDRKTEGEQDGRRIK
jgi:iron complex outermembrane recepter protein